MKDFIKLQKIFFSVGQHVDCFWFPKQLIMKVGFIIKVKQTYKDVLVFNFNTVKIKRELWYSNERNLTSQIKQQKILLSLNKKNTFLWHGIFAINELYITLYNGQIARRYLFYAQLLDWILSFQDIDTLIVLFPWNWC